MCDEHDEKEGRKETVKIWWDAIDYVVVVVVVVDDDEKSKYMVVRSRLLLLIFLLVLLLLLSAMVRMVEIRWHVLVAPA